MKKNKMMRIASVLLVAVLLSTCAISSTFAKYTTEFTGTSTAKVAKWDVKVANSSEDFTFNIMDTIYENVDGTVEDEDVADGVIAPGTKGSFSVVVTNNSEVNATYVVALSDEAAELPFNFTIENGTGDLDMDATATVTVNWEWPYEGGDDAADLALAGTDLTVAVKVTVDQAD